MPVVLMTGDDCVPGWLWNPEFPGSLNSTINIEEYPASMSSVSKLVRALWRVGRWCLVAKADWVLAYKHQHVSR